MNALPDNRTEQHWRPDPAGVADVWLIKVPHSRVRTRFRELARELIARLASPGTELLRDPFGKPFLSPGAFEISISHSGSWLAVAANSVPFGIDVEDASLPRPLDGAASIIMPPETLAEWREGGRPAGVFFENWTRREAIAKAAGRGLTGEILTAPLGSVFRAADAVIHHYHIRTQPDLHLAMAAVAPQRLLRLTRLASDLEPQSEETHILADEELQGSGQKGSSQKVCDATVA
jgi:phosphopantetheinyl transferase